MIRLNSSHRIILASFSALSLLAAAQAGAGSFWDSKPPSAWTEADAQQILTNSPWAKEITAGLARRQTEDQLREGGVMGQPRGIGNEGVDPKGSGPKVSLDVLTGAGGDDRSPRSRPGSIRLRVRWESAMPVRLAELKAHTIESAVLPGEGYEIAVYGIPPVPAKEDLGKLTGPLKNDAALRRDGKKDVKPERVEVVPGADGLVVVYLFPLTAEIVERDGWVVFEAHIGRISVTHGFELQRMKFLGKLLL